MTKELLAAVAKIGGLQSPTAQILLREIACDALPEGILVVDLARRILFANRTAVEKLDHATLDGLFMEDLLQDHEIESGRHTEIVDSYLRDPERESSQPAFEVEGKTRTGALVPMTITLSASQVFGETVAVALLGFSH